MPDHIQRIGTALRHQCPIEAAQILLYAEVEDGVISASVFFQLNDNVAHFRYASDELEDLVYEFWETGNDRIPARSWRGMEYALSGTKFDIELSYENAFNPNEGQHERRPRVVARHFPGAKTDFTQPDG
jgi:hypothetical protein